MMVVKTRQNPAQWVVLFFLIGVITAGMYFGKDNPNTPWGPIILGAFGLMGLVVRAIFNPPNRGEDDDGYGRY